jgi:site-specific recombinase XerD
MSESDANEELLKVVSELQEEVEQLREENRKLRGEDDKPPAPPNDEIVERHFEDKNYADSTERPKRHAINYFRRHLDDKPFREVTTDDALDFANNWSGEGSRPKRSSILNYLKAVKALYDWMMRQEWGRTRMLLNAHGKTSNRRM